MGSKILFAIGMVALLITSASAWAVPDAINFQGNLTDSVGKALSGTYGMQFFLCDAPEEGNCNLVEEQDVEITDGIFDVLLGNGTPIPSSIFESDSLYLEVHIGSGSEWEVLSPRQPITSVPYARMAGDSDMVDGQHASDLGDITEVSAGTGLTGGGTAGAVTLSADTSVLQSRVNDSCPAGQSIRAISSTGTVTCEEDDGLALETDPVFGASPSSGISAGAITNWNTAFSWGNHGTAGYDTTNDTWVGTGNVYMLSGNVGIGTNIPSYKLEVRGNTNDYLAYLENNSFVSGGDARGLTVVGDAYSSGDGDGYGGSFIAIGNYTNGTAVGIESRANAYGSATAIGVYSDAVIGSATTGKEYAFYGFGDGYFSGDVGIGTDDPSYKLEVRGGTPYYLGFFYNENSIAGAGPPNFTAGIYAAGDARNTGVDLGTGGVFYGYGGSTGGQASGIEAFASAYGISNAYGVYSDATIGTTTGKTYAFYGLGDGYFSGNVGIGTYSPAYALDISGHSRVQGPEGFNSAGETAITYYGDGNHYIKGTYAGGLNINSFNGATDPITFSFSGSEKMRITNTGSVGIGTTSPDYKLQVGEAGDGTQARANAWNTLSDGSLKSNLAIINDAVDKVNHINGYYFNWKNGADKSRQVGVVAQEVEEVLPEIVSSDKTGLKSLDYGKLVPLLVEAVKEQQEIIFGLQEQNKQISEKINALESELKMRNSFL